MSDIQRITSSHLARLAVVYLRQSSSAQVEHNRESTDRQYALAHKARSCRPRAATLEAWNHGLPR